MDLRQLASLVAVAETGTFSAAAIKLHTVQSNVSTHVARLERELGVTLVDHGPVVFRDGGTVRRVPRDEFAELARAGRVTPETVVFDNTISRLAALRGGGWELPASASWHGRAFF
jgi:hypothetical protein